MFLQNVKSISKTMSLLKELMARVSPNKPFFTKSLQLF